VVAVTLSSPAEVQILGLIAAQKAVATATAEVQTRTYHLGHEPTPGRGYDDRLTMRTGVGLTKLRELLALPIERGGLRHQRNGRNYIVTERAVCEFFDENTASVAVAA
jgi:hypothetical protein